MPMFDNLRQFGIKAIDLDEPADPMPPLRHQEEDDLYDIETTNYLLNEGYQKSSRFGIKKNKERHRVYNCNDQVNTLKAVDAESSEDSIDDNYAKSKAAREQLESVEDMDETLQ